MTDGNHKLPGPGEKPTIKGQLQMIKALAKKDGRDVLPGLTMPRKGTPGPRGPYDRAEDRVRPLIIKELRRRGFKTWRVETSIMRQLGLGDLWVMHRLGRWAGWIEIKSDTGRQSPEQKEFQELCLLNKVNYVVIRTVEEVGKILS